MAARVLIAHPEAAERSRIAGVVRRAGLEVVEAHDGISAIAQASGTSLAFLAPRLSRNDGLFVAGRLRQTGEGTGPAVVLLNDVYPVEQPKDRFLREFGLSEALTSPADARSLVELLGRMRRLPKRNARDAAKSTDLKETPLIQVLTRLNQRSESAFVYARRGEEATFIVLVQGDVAQVRSNRQEFGTDEQLLLATIAWADGDAVVISDPDIEKTSAARIYLAPLLDQAVLPPHSEELLEAAQRALTRSARIVVEPSDECEDRLKQFGAGLFQRQILELADGERSLQRLSGLAEVGRLPLATAVLRLEAIGLLRRRRPGAARKRTNTRVDWSTLPPLPEAACEVANSGLLGSGDLARLLVRLERSRTSAVLAIKGRGRTIEIAIRDGRITGAHAWGASVANDPVQHLATMSELRPDDVPLIRRLHAQALVAEALVMTDSDWTLRRGEAIRMVETSGTSSAALVTELLRDGRLSLDAGPKPNVDFVAAMTPSLGLTWVETAQLEQWAGSGATPDLAWLGATTALVLDMNSPLGRQQHERRALPPSPEEAPAPKRASSDDDLDSMFQRALAEGMRAGTRAGARPAESGRKPAAAAEPSRRAAEPVEPVEPSRKPVEPSRKPAETSRKAAPSADAASKTAGPVAARERNRDFDPLPTEGLRAVTLEQGASGVVIRVGERQYPINSLVEEVNDLRRETSRLRTELANRNDAVEVQAREAEAVRKTVHELEEFIVELRSGLVDREQSTAKLTAAQGHLGAEVEAMSTILAEKDRLLNEQNAVAREFEDRLAEAIHAGEQQQRIVEDLKREREGFKERAARLDRELKIREQNLSELDEQVRLAGVRSAQTERDLMVARRERDELAAKVTTSAPATAKRRLFRDARTEQVEVESSSKVTEERRAAMEALRAESTVQSHRIIELEGKITRQEAELARQRRERTRLDEKLETALAEATARTEEQAAHRTRWTAAERLLAERTSALQVREEEINGLRNLRTELASDLETARAGLRERGDALAIAHTERSELRTRAAELDGELTRLRNEVASFAEERGRLEWSVEEARQTSARATSALEAVRTAREELSVRLRESIAQKTTLEEARERYNAEVTRLSTELQQERDARSQERASLEGKLAARNEEFAGTQKGLRDALVELGKLRDQQPTLVSRHDEAVARLANLEKQLSEARTMAAQLTRDLETQREESAHQTKQIQLLHAEMATHQSSWKEERESLRNKLEATLRDHDALEHRLQAATRELSSHLDRTPALKRERDAGLARIGQLEDEAAQLRRELATEHARSEHQHERLTAELEFVAELQRNIENREASLKSLHSELSAAADERSELRTTLDRTVVERDEQVGRLQASLDGARRELESEVATFKARSTRLEETVQRLTDQESQLRHHITGQDSEVERLNTQMSGARKRVAQDVRRISELVALTEDLKARLSEREDQVRGLQTQLSEQSQRAERVTADLQNRDRTLSSLQGTADNDHKSLAEMRDQLVAMTRSERDFRSRSSSLEADLHSLKNQAQQLTAERQTLIARLDEEQRQAALLNANTSKVIAKLRTEVKDAKAEARTAVVREKSLRSKLASDEANAADEMAKGTTSVNEAALLKRQRELSVRISNLEEELAARIATEAAVGETADALHGQSLRATGAAEEAQRHAAKLAQELEQYREREKVRAKEIRELEHALMERENNIEMRDLLVAERDGAMADLEEQVALLNANLEQARQQIQSMSAAGKRDAVASSGPIRPTTIAPVAGQLSQLQPPPTTELQNRHAVTRPIQGATASSPDPSARSGSLRQLNAILSDIDRLSEPSPTAARQAPTRAELMMQKEALLDASNRLNRELTRLRDEMESRAAELAGLDPNVQPANDPNRPQLDQRRQALADELHAIQANLGIGRVRMADINRQIMEKGRLLQRLADAPHG